MSLDTSFDIKNVMCLFFYDLRDTINLYNLNKDHQDNIIITNLYDIPYEYLTGLNQQIIEQNKYKYVKKLNAYDNKEIKNVNHMKNLKILDCGSVYWMAGAIDQNGISELNLIELIASNNARIKNVNHMKKTLKILNCSYDCGIDQNGISELNLIELRMSYNNKIKNINYMKKTLKILCYGGYVGFDIEIDQKGISELNLIKLITITENNDLITWKK